MNFSDSRRCAAEWHVITSAMPCSSGMSMCWRGGRVTWPCDSCENASRIAGRAADIGNARRTSAADKYKIGGFMAARSRRRAIATNSEIGTTATCTSNPLTYAACRTPCSSTLQLRYSPASQASICVRDPFRYMPGGSVPLAASKQKAGD